MSNATARKIESRDAAVAAAQKAALEGDREAFGEAAIEVLRLNAEIGLQCRMAA